MQRNDGEGFWQSMMINTVAGDLLVDRGCIPGTGQRRGATLEKSLAASVTSLPKPPVLSVEFARSFKGFAALNQFPLPQHRIAPPAWIHLLESSTGCRGAFMCFGHGSRSSRKCSNRIVEGRLGLCENCPLAFRGK